MQTADTDDVALLPDAPNLIETVFNHLESNS